MKKIRGKIEESLTVTKIRSFQNKGGIKTAIKEAPSNIANLFTKKW